jgi:signal transduction histidine kinase
VVTTGQPAVIEDYRAYPNALPPFVEAGLASVVVVPLVSANQPFGALGIGFLKETRRFSRNAIATLVGIGYQAGIAIQNARLYEDMRFYARQIIRAQENERKRVAREAHDETAQILVALSRRLDALPISSEPAYKAMEQDLVQLRKLTREALQSVRRFSRGLRPPVLDDLGFVAAVRGLARDLKEVKVEATVEVSGPKQRLSPEEELALFRIAQEALNNVRRHSAASRVAVQVEFHPSNVRMTIQDTGCGFNAPERFIDLVAMGKLGLIGMYERARILGGTLQIQSDVDKGTKVSVDVPVHPRTRDEDA